jgi:pilus assembly protein Flp/PilA
MLAQFYLWLNTFFGQKEDGQTLVEYALIIALIAIVLIAALITLRGGIGNVFNTIASNLNNPN